MIAPDLEHIRALAMEQVAQPQYRPFTLAVTAVEEKGDNWWYVVVQPTSPIERERDYYAALRAIENAIEEQVGPEYSVLVVPVLPPGE